MDNDFIKLLLEVHNDLPQEGPGSKASTLKAFSLIKDFPDHANILDIGCGPGRQTIDLSEKVNATISAIDIFEQYLDQLRAKIKENGLESKIRALNCPMEKLVFQKESFDLIWSEGAAYLMGFDNALAYWKDFLKPKGYLAVTEIVWLRADQPEEIKRFWQDACLEIKTIEENISLIEKMGYQVIGHFTLPQTDWLNYYNPLKKRIEALKKRKSPALLAYIESEEDEIGQYEKYSDYYGYEFFVLKYNRD